jgi:hypothetical protein
MRVISRVSLAIENAPACRAPTRQHPSTTDSTHQLLVEAQMNKFEVAIAEEIVVETIDEQAMELSLPELEMVGGGGMCVALC